MRPVTTLTAVSHWNQLISPCVHEHRRWLPHFAIPIALRRCYRCLRALRGEDASVRHGRRLLESSCRSAALHRPWVLPVPVIWSVGPLGAGFRAAGIAGVPFGHRQRHRSTGRGWPARRVGECGGRPLLARLRERRDATALLPCRGQRLEHHRMGRNFRQTSTRFSSTRHTLRGASGPSHS